MHTSFWIAGFCGFLAGNLGYCSFLGVQNSLVRWSLRLAALTLFIAGCCADWYTK